MKKIDIVNALKDKRNISKDNATEIVDQMSKNSMMVYIQKIGCKPFLFGEVYIRSDG